MNEKLVISRKAYDELCHSFRHLMTDMERSYRRTEHIYGIISSLREELREQRANIMDRAKVLETLFNRIKVCDFDPDETKVDSGANLG